MSAPKRWLDGGDDLTPEERRTLGADLAHDAPPHAKRAVRAALALKLTAASAAAAAAPSAARGSVQKGAAAKLMSLTVVKSAAVGFALSAVVGAGFSLRDRQDVAHAGTDGTVRNAPSAPSSPALRAPAGSAATLPPAPSSAPNDAPQGRAQRHSVVREAAGASPSLPVDASPSESQRVAEARALLRAGRASDALAALQALERDEPNGLLAQEREALSIQALAALGQRDRARQRAAAFTQRYPDSPHLAVVRRAAE
ncbi:MAG: hypothetical protein ABUL60_03800 [Myxococcales bacterium]